MAIIEGPSPNSNEAPIMEIGRIPNLRPDIDQKSKISTELKKRMGIIDLIPCNFDMSLTAALKDGGKLSDAFKPKIVYKEPISNYQEQLGSYGLDKSVEFLRVYLTDSTTVSETLTNNYMKNVISDSLNSLSSSKVGKFFQSIDKMFQSMGQAKRDTHTGASTPDITSYSEAMEIVDDVLTHGTRIALPKIWSGNEYSPQLTCSVKLVSPYGHPDAIARFIIRPLGYLMMLLSPRTAYGLVTKRPSYVALKSYGMSNLRIASPSVIEIRRGGDDNSYNQYKQPLSVEVALTFDALTEGFAAFDTDEEHDELGIFSLLGTGCLTKKFDDEFETTPSALFPTMKSLVNSFRPFDYQESESTTPLTPSSDRSSISDTSVSNPSSTGKESVDSFSEDVLMSSGTNRSVSSTTNTLLPPSILEHSDKSLSFTTNNITSNFEVLVIFNDSESVIETIDPSNFVTGTSVIASSLSTDSNSNSHKLTFRKSTFQDQDNFLVLVRNMRSDGLPGVWSEVTDIKTTTNDYSLILDILPTSLITNDGLRWRVNDSRGTSYGPFLYGANLEYGDYTLEIIDNESTVVYEKEIVVSESNKYQDVIFDIDKSNLNVNINTDLSNDDFKYFLTSESDASIYESSTGSFEGIQTGYYNLMLEYQNKEVLYDDGVYDSVLITSSETSINLTVNSNRKITLIEMV